MRLTIRSGSTNIQYNGRVCIPGFVPYEDGSGGILVLNRDGTIIHMELTETERQEIAAVLTAKKIEQE